MVSIEQYYENIKKIFGKNTILEALDEMNKLSDNPKTLISLMAFRMEENENGKFETTIDMEELEVFYQFLEMKKQEGFFDKPLTPEELETMNRLNESSKEPVIIDFDDMDEDMKEFLENDIYCDFRGKKIEPDEELKADNPFDIKRHKTYHVHCYDKKQKS